MNKCIRDDLAGCQQGHRVIRQPIPIPCHDLSRFHILRNPAQDIIQDDRQRPREITTVNGSHIICAFDCSRDRQVREKALRILTQRIQAGDRQLFTFAVRNDARVIKDRFVTLTDETWGRLADRREIPFDQV